MRTFARQVDVVTFEFENIPTATAEKAAEYAPVRPAGSVLYTTQNRLREKTFLAGAGFPVVPFRPVTSLVQLTAALDELARRPCSRPPVGATTARGRCSIDTAAGAADAWQTVATGEAVLEAFVDFQCEASVVVARAARR